MVMGIGGGDGERAAGRAQGAGTGLETGGFFGVEPAVCAVDVGTVSNTTIRGDCDSNVGKVCRKTLCVDDEPIGPSFVFIVRIGDTKLPTDFAPASVVTYFEPKIGSVFTTFGIATVFVHITGSVFFTAGVITALAPINGPAVTTAGITTVFLPILRPVFTTAVDLGASLT